MPASPAEELARLDKLANLLDSQWRIPLTPVRFGADALLGLAPVAGDLVTGAVAGWIVYRAARLGVPRRILAVMAGNVVLDTAVGAVPVLGSVFDVFFKASRRNLKLLHRHFDIPPSD